LRAAVERAPDDLALRLHLAGLLLDAGRADESIAHLAAVLAQDPGSAEARALMARAVAPEGPPTGRPAVSPPAPPVEPTAPSPSQPVEPPAAQSPPDIPHPAPPGDGFDWASAETELGDVVPPMFVDGSAGEDASELGPAYDLERSTVRLSDVGGMTEVKARLEAAFLAPMRNPELRRLYGKSLRGGLLMYGPPGCGKTFLARAVAGEMGAAFLAVSLADVLDMWIGQSERNLHQLFEHARRSAPCVLFLDEVDAIGQKRSHLRNSAMRGTVNQLLGELDSVSSANEGVFVLAATNHPWDVDSALRRPGRLDRTLLVLPPDEPAREAVLRYHLRDRPVAGIDLRKLAKRTDGYSGADLAHACETAAERAMIDAARTGSVRMIDMADFDAALQEVRPSIGPWFDTARNVALFANEGGAYDELLGYLKKRRLV
jgi:AAA+ superfamily predicted ATPase